LLYTTTWPVEYVVVLLHAPLYANPPLSSAVDGDRLAGVKLVKTDEATVPLPNSKLATGGIALLNTAWKEIEAIPPAAELGEIPDNSVGTAYNVQLPLVALNTMGADTDVLKGHTTPDESTHTPITAG
jgi:hypothetical protein